MNTADRQAHCERSGFSLRRQEYLTEYARGYGSGYRWDITERSTGRIIATGRTPAQAFKRWQDWRQAQTG